MCSCRPPHSQLYTHICLSGKHVCGPIENSLQLYSNQMCMTNIPPERPDSTDTPMTCYRYSAVVPSQLYSFFSRLYVVCFCVAFLKQKSRIYSNKCYFVCNIRSKQHETTGIFCWHFFFPFSSLHFLFSVCGCCCCCCPFCVI